VALWFVGIFAFSAAAHHVALKNGRIIQFEKYRVVSGQLYYTDSNGNEIQVALGDIDFERTKRLRSADNSTLNLSGLEPQGAQPAPNTSESLGDTARKVRPKNAPSTPQRVFTDDDIAHSSSTMIGLPVGNSTDFQSRMQNAQRLVDKWADKRPRELSDGIVGDNKFPGRDAWEQRLYEQKGKMVKAAQVALDASQRVISAPTSEERASARKATDKLLSDLDWQRTLYDQLVAEGVKKASEWERQHR